MTARQQMQFSSLPQPNRHNPQQSRAQERLRQIIAAAAYEFQENGVERTSTNHIAARAKIPVGSVYKYFTDKNAIISTLLALYQNGLTDTILEATHTPFLADSTVRSRVELIFKGIASYCEINKPFTVIAYIQSDPNWADCYAQLSRALYDTQCAALEQIGATNGPEIAVVFAKLSRNYAELPPDAPSESRDHLVDIASSLIKTK